MTEKRMSIMRKITGILIAISLIACFTSCSGGNKEAEKEEPEVEKYKLNIEVECLQNLLLNKYDIEISVNDKIIGTLKHGETGSFSTELEAGDYNIVFEEKDGDASGSVGVSISGNTDLKYIISCGGDEISIDEVILSDTLIGQKKDDVIKQLRDAGFTNIKERANYDIYFDKESIGNVEAISIDGNKEFRSFDDFEKDVRVTVKYHEYYEKDPEYQEDESGDSSNQTTETPEKKEDIVLTIDNSEDLKKLLESDDEIDAAEFAEKYAGKTIEFDGSIDYLVNHGDYKTRYDFLLSYGDYSEDSQVGPTFKFENYNVSNPAFPDESYALGDSVHVVAEVDEFKASVFYLKPIKVTHR